MRKIWRWKPGPQAPLIYLVMLVMLILSCVLPYLSLRTQLLKNMQNLGTAIAKSYAADSNRDLVVYETLLALTAEGVDIRRGASKEEMEDWFQRYMERVQPLLGEDAIVPYMVFEGEMIVVEPWSEVAACDYPHQDWYKMALEADGDVIFTDIYECSVYHRPVIMVAKKCADTDAVVGFNIHPDNFQFVYAPQKVTEEASFYLCDRNGQIIYRQTSYSGYSEEQLRRYIDRVTGEIESGKHDAFDSKTIDPEGRGRAVYYYYMPNGWLSIYTVPYSSILAETKQFSLRFGAVFLFCILATCLIALRNLQLNQKIARTNDAVRVLGNSYYALYRVDYRKETYEMIKGSEYVRSQIPHSGPYAVLLSTMSEIIEKNAYDEYIHSFSIENIRNLVAKQTRDFGGDFQRLFGTEYRWVNVRILFDESLSPHEVVICFREVEEEKQREFKERKLLEDALESSRRSEKSKQVFFSSMSHDMRTPLGAIIGLSKLVQEHVTEPEKVSGYIGKILFSSQTLLNLLNDILEMSRMDQGKVILNYQPVNIRECVEECASVFRMQADAEKKEFTVSCDLQDEVVLSDVFRLNQILNNLLSNAFKFTHTGDAIRVEATQSESEGHTQYRLIVRDSGIGMSEGFLPQLFDPYVRETRFAENRSTGYGLGMPIVKNLVEQMNGEIRVKSILGRGTAFTIILPFDPIKGEEGAPDEKKEPEVSADFSLRGKKILLAEDNEINMEIATELLTMNGAEVTPAWDGEEAVRLFKESAPFAFDAILMDYQMPRMDGCEAARSIRQLHRADARSIPIIAVTANAFAEDIAATSAAGMNAHISKPIDFELVYRLLKKFAREADE